MTWWETFLAGFTAGLAALALLATLLIVHWVRKAQKAFLHVSDKFAARLHGPDYMPARIQWRPGHVESDQRARLAAISQILESLGFAVAGTFMEAETGTLMRGWINAEQSAIAAAYLFPLGTPWLELVSTYADGSACVFSNSELSDLKCPPNLIREYRPGASPRELLTAFLEHRKPEGLNPVSVNSLTTTLEQLHAKEFDWRQTEA